MIKYFDCLIYGRAVRLRNIIFFVLYSTECNNFYYLYIYGTNYYFNNSFCDYINYNSRQKINYFSSVLNLVHF